jgi:biopolymer transport protein ExbD
MRMPSLGDGIDEINAVPINAINFVDIIFNLLIFFMAMVQFGQEERQLDAVLPDAASASPMTMPPKELVVNVDREGRYFVHQRNLDEAALAEQLRRAGADNPGLQSVLIRGDGRADWKAVARVMSLCNAAKITDYRVAVVQEEGR